MENINISLGIELDKKQFNDNYIQGQVDKAASNIAVKVNNVKIKDVSKSIQNDLDKQVGNLDVQIKGVSLDESEIKSTVNRISDFIQKSLNSLPKEHMFKFTTDNGMLDVKQLQKEITNGIKNAINESMDLAEIDFDKLSVTGGKKIANSIGDILQAESVASNVKEEVSKINNELDKVSDKKVEIEAEVDDKYREGIESIKRDIESLSSDLSLFGVSDSKSLSEYENKINDIFKRINEIGKLNIDIDFSELEGIYNELDKIRDKIDNEFQKSLQVDKDDELEWLSDNIKSVEDDIQKLEVALSKINLADGISDDDKISELKNKINSLSDELEIFYNEDITKSFNQDINDMILRLEELKTVLDSVNNSKIKEEQMDSSNEKKSKDGLNLEISDVIIIDEEKIVSSLQNSLDSISKRLSILVEHIKLSSDNSDIVDVTNLELSNISGKLNSLEVGIAITDEFKAAILSDMESLFNQVEPILEKLENKFKVTTSKIEQYFGAVITKITNDLSYLFSENIKFDFTKSKLIGLDDKLNSIREKLTLQINDIDLGELAYKNEEIQTQLNVFTSEVALEIKNIKLLNVVEEIQTKLDDIGKDLEITVKNVNIDSNKSVSDDNRETNNTSTVIDKPITSKELKSQISKMKEKYNNEVNSLIDSFVDENSLKGLKGKIKNAIKSDSLGSSETYDEIVKAAENYIYKYNKNETKKHTNDILKEYNALREALKGVVFKEADLKGLDKDQLSQFKKSISGIATISKEAGISVDKFMEEFKDLASLSGFDMGGDVLEDNLMRLSEIMSEMKNIKKNGVSAGLTSEEEEEYLSHVTNKYIELIGKVEELKSVRNDGISAIQKEFELSQKLTEEQKKSENNIDISSDMNDISEATNKANSELKEYNDELSKITKTSVTFVDNERKSVSQTTEGLGKTTTSTTKFNVDGSITEIDKIVNNTKAFNKEIDSIRSKIENLNNTDADTIGKISEQLNNFKVGDSIDAFERLKREVEELSKLDKNIDNVRETISKLNAELRDSKIEGYFDKSVFKEIQKSIDSITTDSTEEEIKSVSDRIKELGKTKNDIVNINKTIDDLSRSLTKLKNGTGNDKLSLTENSSSVGAMTRNINSLIKMRDKLVSGEFLGSKVEQSIVAANNRMKDLQVTISATTKNINELQKQKGISENVFIKQEDLINKLKKLYSDGFIDESQFKKLQNKINNINTDKLKSEVKSIENEFANLAKNGKQLNNVTKAINKITKDVDNVVSENIKFIDSDKAISEVNSLMSKLNELNILRDKLSNGELVGNKAINEAISGVKKVADIYTQTLSNLASNQKIFDNISKNLDNATTNKAVLGLDDSYVNKLRDELNNIDLSSNEAQTSLKELESTVKRIGNSDKDIQKLKGVIQQLEGNISKISDKQKFSIVTESDINKMNEMKSHVNSLNNVIDKLNNGIEVTQIEIRDLEATSKNSMENISSVTESASDSFSDLGVSLNRAMEFAIGDSISGILEEQVRMAGQTILDIDDKIRDLKRVTKLTAEEYKEFTKSSNETAISIGRSTAEAIEATTSFVKLGYSVEEAKGYLSEAGLTLANVADMNTEDSIDAITSTLKGFGLEVQEVTRVIDVMNESGNKFALSTSDLAEMLRIGSASMSIAGNNLEQTSALMISAFEILQDSSKVANGLKTISMRLRGVAEEGEELNPKLGELVKTLTGVDLTDANGEFRNTYEVLSEIGQVFDTLGSKEQALLLEQLAGKNQANVLAALFKNINQLPKAYQTLTNSAGSAAKEQESYINSLSGKINALKENIAGIWINLIDSKVVGNGITLLSNSIGIVGKFVDTVGTIPAIVGTATLAFTAFSEKGRKIAESIVEMTPGIHKINGLFDVMTEKLNKKFNATQLDIALTKDMINQNKASGESFAGLSVKLAGYNAKLAATKVGMLAVKAAATLMNSALSVGLSMLVGWGISTLTKFVDELYTTKSELKELNSEFANTNKNNANLSSLSKQYKDIAESMKGVSSISPKYVEAEEQLKSIEEQLISIYPELNDLLQKNTNAKWENVEAIEKMTEKELEAARAKAEVNLSKNKIKNADDIKEEVEAYNNLIEKRKQYTEALSKGRESFVSIDDFGTNNSPKSYQKELEKVNKEIGDYETKLKAIHTALNLVGDDNRFHGSLKLVSESLGIVREEMKKTKDASDSLGEGFASAAIDAEKLSGNISSISGKLDTLNTMIEEFEKYGNLTHDTYLKVLTSGEEELIALLADSDKFLERAYEKRKQYLSNIGEDAKSLIGSSYANQYGDGVYIDQDSLKYTFENISDMASSMVEEINSSISNINVNSLGDNLKNVFSEVTSESKNLSKFLEDGIQEYVLASINAGEQSAEAIISAEEAKQQATEKWKNQEVIELAEMVNANAGQYGEDVENWARAVANKQADNVEWSDNVYKFISDMIAYSNGAYSDDVTNWAIALGNKDYQNTKMVNSVMSSIAKMILANQQNYSSDTVAWANAINNKIKNNSVMCNTVSQKMADAINNMIDNYGKDVNQFRQAIIEKARMYDVFNTNIIKSQKNTSGTTGYTFYTDAALKTEQEKVLDKVINEVKSNYQSKPVSGVNVGSSGVGSIESPDKNKDKDKDKEVEDMEDVVDRYYALNNALQKIENEISAIDTELETKTGKDRIALIEKEIKLLNDKRMALVNIRNEQQNELSELRNNLAQKGFGFASDGQISNYSANLSRLVANANKLTGDAKEKAIANVKEVVEQLERYTSLLLNDIPDITNQINGITGSVSDLREEIDEIIKDTTFFTKDFIDRYYELNNALKQVENQLNAISTAMKNADDNKLMELLDKQIELYIKQGEALAELKKENVKELNELGKELYDAGFSFNSDGTISNYQSQIDKMVQDANKITDGKKQEKEIERINSLIESIERYTDLLLNDIPDIKNDMEDLTNSVIDSQKEIASILSKQKDEYIDNLKKETEALKKEIEKRKEILQKQWEQEDTADELAEKQQKLNELEDQLTLALRTGDEELIKNIREQITAAQKEINDFIRDQERDYISDRFDEDLDKIDEDLDSKIDEINKKLSDEELLKLVQSGVRDLTGVLNEIEGGTKGVRSAFAAIGTTISDTWINALDTFVDKLNGLQDINLGFNLESKLSKFINGISRTFNINQGNLIVQGNITEDILPVVQGMIDTANNNLIRDINAAFSR